MLNVFRSCYLNPWFQIYLSKYYRLLWSWSAPVKSTSFKTYTGEITDPDKYKSKDKYKEGHPDMFYMGISFIIELPAIIRPARLSSGRSSGASGGAGAFLGCLSQGSCSPHFSCFSPRPIRLLRFSCASCAVVHVRSPQGLLCVQKV